ncbi:hypothetical protein Fmac_006502 [Flemingia macrophylla]|uniref:Secreted protein n=1 Tax=Flemingia macrophylla TaxID=520843 RepID=A0ABD1NAS2_9FABA
MSLWQWLSGWLSGWLSRWLSGGGREGIGGEGARQGKSYSSVFWPMIKNQRKFFVLVKQSKVPKPSSSRHKAGVTNFLLGRANSSEI